MFRPNDSIRAVLLDAVGTLIRPEPSVAAAYLAAARQFGLANELTEIDVSRRFRTAFARQEALDRAADWKIDEAREFRRWQDIVFEVFGDSPHWHARGGTLFATLWNHFADPDNWTIVESAQRQIDAARNAGHIIGVASNFDSRLHGILAAMPRLGIRENIFVSSEVGYRKPSRDFFHTIERQLNLAPEQLLLIGDDIENDYNAARLAGWQAFLVTPQ